MENFAEDDGSPDCVLAPQLSCARSPMMMGFLSSGSRWCPHNAQKECPLQGVRARYLTSRIMQHESSLVILRSRRPLVLPSSRLRNLPCRDTCGGDTCGRGGASQPLGTRKARALHRAWVGARLILARVTSSVHGSPVPLASVHVPVMWKCDSGGGGQSRS